MIPTFPRSWLRLQTRELDAEILKQRLPFHVAEALREAVRVEKTALKSANAKRRVRLHRWRDLIRQAKYEAHKVTLRVEYLERCPDDDSKALRLEAQVFYSQVLRECIRRLEAQRDTPDLPLPKSYDYRDFIPDKIKAQVHLRFDAIPRGERKRVADPFGDGKPRLPRPDPTRLEVLASFKSPAATPDPKQVEALLFRAAKRQPKTHGQPVPEFNLDQEGEKQ